MSPAGDGVVRDVEVIKIFHESGKLIGGDGMKDSKVKGEGDGRFIEGHFRPGEFDGEIGLDAIDGVVSDSKRFAG